MKSRCLVSFSDVSIEFYRGDGSFGKVPVEPGMPPEKVAALVDNLLKSNGCLDDELVYGIPSPDVFFIASLLDPVAFQSVEALRFVVEEKLPIDAEEMFQAVIKRLENVGGKKKQKFALSGNEASIPVSKENLGNALVVDDDENERELLAGFLRMCDYDVNTVKDGLEAEQFLKLNKRPEFILLDMYMPRCNGRQFLSTLRQNKSYGETHVFVVSGSSPDELQMSVRDGYTHWFNKPLDPRRIVEALTQIEGSSQQMQCV